ncbi:MAG: YdeI/OmpD-associated family protein [Gaiella sp.]
MAEPSRVEIRTRVAWRTWLERHHDVASGVWVVYRKQHAAGPDDPRYDDLVEEALCFGWVDSRPGRVDEDRTSLTFSPRKPGSGWAATNKARIERLTSAGLMAEAGLAAVERARADGSWSRIDGSEAGQVPDDLDAAFGAHPGARVHWDAFPPGVRRSILQWIEQARTAPTRARRIEETAAAAAGNVRANQWVPKAERGAP